MADEISVVVQMAVNKNLTTRDVNYDALDDLSAERVWGPVTLSIGTTYEQISPTDVGTIKWVAAKNLDTSDTISLAPDNTNTMITLPPEAPCIFPLDSSEQLWAKSNGAGAVLLEVAITDT